MIRLSKKFIRRAITGLALLAPIVYLFGNLFASLNGAHGAFPFAGDYDVVTDYRHVDFNQLVYNGDFSFQNGWGGNLGTIAIADNKITFTITNPNAGNFISQAGEHFPAVVIGHKYFCSATMTSSVNSYGAFYCGGATPAFPLTVGMRARYDVITTANNNSALFAVYCNRSVDMAIGDFCIFENVWCVDLTRAYGAGNEPSIADFVADFPELYYPTVNSSRYSFPVLSKPDNYQFIFNQFFGKSNFLTSWGEDAISENPHGFAPFGNMLQFVDENMLHLSDVQIGLMAYGYFYYCAHVLLFVCFFDLTTFFLSWILRITHKFGGADYED